MLVFCQQQAPELRAFVFSELSSNRSMVLTGKPVCVCMPETQEMGGGGGRVQSEGRVEGGAYRLRACMCNLMFV